MSENMGQGESSLGIRENIAGVLCYSLLWVSGLAMFFLEKKSRFVKFHALQSLITFGLLTAVGMVFRRVPVLGFLVGLGTFSLGVAAWVVGMLRAYRGEILKFPIVGDIAQRQIPEE